MSSPRFLLLSTVTGAGDQISWRLVGGNNHDLGRSPVAYADAEQARAAVAHLRLAVEGASCGFSPDSQPGRWGWQVRQGSDVLAVSSRRYERQRESRYNLAQFLAAVPVAVVSDVVAVRRRPRELRRADSRVPRSRELPDRPAAPPVVPAQAAPVEQAEQLS